MSGPACATWCAAICFRCFEPHTFLPRSSVLSELERFISVDVETAGPEPSRYPLLSIGACLVIEPDRGFYVELQPDADETQPDALAVSGLSLAELRKSGSPPAAALQDWADWLEQQVSSDPIMVALNAPFDWSFVNSYFHRYLGHNPFGHAALDIKAYAMGALALDWRATSFDRLVAEFQEGTALEHNALADARAQARLFRALLEHSRTS